LYVGKNDDRVIRMTQARRNISTPEYSNVVKNPAVSYFRIIIRERCSTAAAKDPPIVTIILSELLSIQKSFAGYIEYIGRTHHTRRRTRARVKFVLFFLHSLSFNRPITVSIATPTYYTENDV